MTGGLGYVDYIDYWHNPDTFGARVLAEIDKLQRDLAKYHGIQKAYSELEAHADRQRESLARLHEAHDRLPSELKAYKKQCAELVVENAKLRELVRDMWFWGYEGHMSSESQEWQMKHIDGVHDRMRELGIEV